MAFPSPRVPQRRTDRLLRRALIALSLALLLGAPALAASCNTPPSDTEPWHFVDYITRNRRLISTSDLFYGPHRTADSEVNWSSTTAEDVRLSWRGYRETRFSKSFEWFEGRNDTRERDGIKVTLDLAPQREALLKVREVRRFKYYTFDVGCLWFNEATEQYHSMIIDHNVSGHIESVWREGTVKTRSVY